MGRAKLKTLKETTLNTFFDLASQLKITDQFTFNGQNGVIYWKNGSEILLKDLLNFHRQFYWGMKFQQSYTKTSFLI